VLRLCFLCRLALLPRVCSVVFDVPLDFLKFFVRYAISGKAWNPATEQHVSAC